MKMKLDPKKLLMWTIIVLIAIIIIWFVYKKIDKIIDKAKEDKKDKELIKQAEDEIITNALTYTTSDYQTMADKLFTAMDGMGTNTTAIKEVIAKLRTKSDWNALIKAFGVREATGWYTNFKGNLVEWLADELSDNPTTRKEVNDMLAKFNVTI